MREIDLRSDTVTRPTAAMRRAMADAEVGDDVFGEDPTVRRLQALAAERFGTEAALFVASGTQGNLVALLTHCGRGDEYVVGQQAHTYRWEGGGGAVLGGINPQPIEHEPDGTLDLDRIRRAVKPIDDHFARTRLLCLENTIGGRALPLDYLPAAGRVAREHHLAVHLDGARLCNAAVHHRVDPIELTRDADTVSVCLSKGLGAPVGSVLCGPADVVERARRWRKVTGGGMRQAGVLAAAGIVALTDHVDRLADDHARAGALGAGLDAIEGVEVLAVATNMVFASFAGLRPGLASHLAESGIRILGDSGAGVVRLVTHLDVHDDDVPTVIDAVARFAEDGHGVAVPFPPPRPPAAPGPAAAPRPPAAPGPAAGIEVTEASLVALLVVTAALSLANGAVFALLAELQDQLGFATWGLGVIAGSGFAAIVVANLALSRHADRGRARALLVSGVVLGIAGTAWMGMATELWQLTGARILLGIGFGAFVPAARKVVIHARPAAAGRYLGRLTSAAVAGFTLGPPIAGGLASAVGPGAPFLVIAVVVAASVPVVTRVPAPPPAPATVPRVLRGLLRLPGVQSALAVAAALFVSVGVFESVWARLLTDLGATPLVVGLSLLAFGIPMALFAPVGGRLADRHGGRRLAIAAVAASLPLMLLYGVVGSVLVLTALSMLHAFCDGTSTPGCQVEVAASAPRDQAGAAQGLLEAVGYGVAAVAAVVAAAVYDPIGPGGLFTATAVVTAALLVVSAWRGRTADRLSRARDPEVLSP